MSSKPKILRRKIAYKSPWFEIVAKEVAYPWQKKTETYFALRGLDYCTVLAVTADNKILVVKQYRPIPERMTYELPSGCVEKGESPETAIRRELFEETGYRAPKKFEFLGKLNPDSGRLGIRLWCYFASGVRHDRKNGAKEQGIETMLCSPREFKRLITSGTLNHAPHIGLVGLAAMKGKFSL